MPTPQEQRRRLKLAMSTLKKTRADLASAGISKSTFTRLLKKDDRGIGQKVGTKLAKGLGLRVEFFFSEQPISVEDAMILPPAGHGAALKKLESASFPDEMDRVALGIRERFIALARTCHDMTVVGALLGARPRSTDESHDPMWWLDVFHAAAKRHATPAANATSTLPPLIDRASPTPPPHSVIAERKAAK